MCIIAWACVGCMEARVCYYRANYVVVIPVEIGWIAGLMVINIVVMVGCMY
jgi:hypothetical protein